MSKLLAYMCLELSILSSVIGLLLAMTTIHLVKTNTQKAKKCVRTNIDGPIGSFDLTEERPADCCEGGREWGRVYFFNVLCAFYFDRDELLWPCNIQLNLNHMM